MPSSELEISRFCAFFSTALNFSISIVQRTHHALSDNTTVMAFDSVEEFYEVSSRKLS
jgi:hypothetical protein